MFGSIFDDLTDEELGENLGGFSDDDGGYNGAFNDTEIAGNEMQSESSGLGGDFSTAGAFSGIGEEAGFDGGSGEALSKGSVLKKVVVLVLIAMVLAVLGFGALKVVKSGGFGGGTGSGGLQVDISGNNDVGVGLGGSAAPVYTPDGSNISSERVDESGEVWQTFDEAVYGDTEVVDAKFTIMSVEHWLRETDGVGSTLRVKTKLKGSISGFGGTHSIDVPYKLGKEVSIGSVFDVKVEFAVIGGKIVIDNVEF